MLDLGAFVDLYLPYLGHFIMAMGYLLEQIESVQPPMPSAVVLVGHLCVLSDPRAISPDQPNVQVINLIFLISNILVFLYDYIISLEYELPLIHELDRYMG
jgi:hypothetical protein